VPLFGQFVVLGDSFAQAPVGHINEAWQYIMARWWRALTTI
jgi:hypothetical protein